MTSPSTKALFLFASGKMEWLSVDRLEPFWDMPLSLDRTVHVKSEYKLVRFQRCWLDAEIGAVYAQDGVTFSEEILARALKELALGQGLG